MCSYPAVLEVSLRSSASSSSILCVYSKTCIKQPLSNSQKIGFQDQLSINAGQKRCRMLQGEHSAILLICIKLPFVIKIFVLYFFEWPLYTGFTIYRCEQQRRSIKAFLGTGFNAKFYQYVFLIHLLCVCACHCVCLCVCGCVCLFVLI